MVQVTIDSLGGLGDGIASHNGKPLFVLKSAAGDVLDVRITQENAREARGDIVSILTPGASRVTPPCPYYADCGGCSLMHLSADYYRDFKRRNFQAALRHAGFPDLAAEIIFLEHATRRRVEFKFDGTLLSYYRAKTRDLVPVEHCLILEPALQALMAPLARALSELSFAHAIKTVGLTLADSGIDMVLSFLEPMANIKSSLQPLLNLRISRISLKESDNIQTIHETSPINMQLGDYAVFLPPNAFLQATKEGQNILTYTILKALKPGTHIVDLFCGIGTYSFPLTGIGRVHAVENDTVMIASMKEAIRQHKLTTKLSVELRDLFKNPLAAHELNKFDAVVINPPRVGAKVQCEAIADSKVPAVIMVSCSQASFSRDAKILKNAGFSAESALGVDQFVYSPHFEIISVFRR